MSKKKKTSVDRLEIIKTNTQDLRRVKPRANGRNIVGQQLPTLSDVTCCARLHTLCMLLRKFEVGQTFEPTIPNISLFRDRRSVTMLDLFAQLFQNF